MTPSVMTRVRYREGVRRLTRRLKINCTWSGRPMSRFSRTTSSKKTRPCAGRSKTWVRANSAWRIDVVADALLPVRGREGVRQAGQPLAQQRVDLPRRQLVGQPLQAFGVRAPQDAVVERLVGDAPFRQLPLEVLVPVDAQLGVVGEVRAELQEERAEVVVDGVEVELVDHRRRGGQPRVGVAGGGVVAAFGAYHLRLLLRLADVEDALAAGPVAEVLPGTVVLALAAAERHDLDPVAGGEALDGVDETPGHGSHQGRGRYDRTPHLAEEVRRPRGPLEQGHVDVEVHPVDALQGQRRVLCQHLGDGTCYLHGRTPVDGLLTGQFTATIASGRP